MSVLLAYFFIKLDFLKRLSVPQESIVLTIDRNNLKMYTTFYIPPLFHTIYIVWKGDIYRRMGAVHSIFNLTLSVDKTLDSCDCTNCRHTYKYHWIEFISSWLNSINFVWKKFFNASYTIILYIYFFPAFG